MCFSLEMKRFKERPGNPSINTKESTNSSINVEINYLINNL